MQPTLTTARLTLRPYTLDDAASVQRLAADQRVANTTIHIPHPYPDGVAESWIKQHSQTFEAGTVVTFAVVLREQGDLVGTVSFLDLSALHARAELGYWIGVPYWGNGYCTEAVECLIRFAQEHLAVTRIVARCFARNHASARVMEKAGLTQEGRLVAHILKNAQYEDMLLYGLVLPGRSGA